MKSDTRCIESARAYRFRIYPDAKRREEIDRRLVLVQRLYNKVPEKSRGAYGKNRDSKINRSTLNGFMGETINGNEDFLLLYSQTRQDVTSLSWRAYNLHKTTIINLA